MLSYYFCWPEYGCPVSNAIILGGLIPSQFASFVADGLSLPLQEHTRALKEFLQRMIQTIQQ
jgi:hypothetical protein